MRKFRHFCRPMEIRTTTKCHLLSDGAKKHPPHPTIICPLPTHHLSKTYTFPAHHLLTTYKPPFHHIYTTPPTHNLPIGWVNLEIHTNGQELSTSLEMYKYVFCFGVHLKIRLFKTIVLVFTLFIHIRNSYCLLIFFGITEKYHIKMTALENILKLIDT